MDIPRRDFFGIIAAPLLRHIGPPPSPIASAVKLENFSVGGVVPTGQFAVSLQDYVISRRSAEDWARKIASLTDAGEITFNVTFEPRFS